MRKLDHKSLKELLHYDPLTGIFRWRVNRPARPIGSIAGFLNGKGYWGILLFNKSYRAHRLAWFYTTGEWPVHEIDHKNGIRTDNRIENLRDVTRSENMQNRRTPIGASGLIGVSPYRGKFCAKISIHQKDIHIGYFLTKEEAREAYLKIKRTLHPAAIWD